jgi:DNA-binding response OmpR family regulator
MKYLLIEDDLNLAETIRSSLLAENHVVDVANNGNEGSFLGRSFDYDAIILDNALPKKDGITVCREIRQSGKSTPILFLSVSDDIQTKLGAFKEGADDYIFKPCPLQELLARLNAVTRRSNQILKPMLRVHDLELDSDRHIVKRSGKRIRLTRKEFSLLEYFMQNTGKVLSRPIIMEHVWTADSNPFSNTVETHIRNLRFKLNSGKKANIIINISGRGYVMDTPENLKQF